MSSPAFQYRSRMPRLAEAAIERARLTVVPRRRVRAARVPFVTLVSMVLLGGVVGLLLFNTSMQQASFAASALESQVGSLSAREQTLGMELDVLRNPQRVARQAQRMGMVTAGSPAFLRLGDGKVLGETSPGVPLRLDPKAPPRPASLNPAPIYVDAVPGATAAMTGKTNGKTNGKKSGKTGAHSGAPSGDGASGSGRNNSTSHQHQNTQQSHSTQH